MIAQDRLQTGNTGHNALRTAAEAGEEMGLDKTGYDAHVGVDKFAIEQGRGAVAGAAQFQQGSRVLRFMV